MTRDRFGYIASPRYPDNYPSNSNFAWTIDGGEEVVTLRIHKIEISDCENDFITVYDGPNTGASKPVKFSGLLAPLNFTSTSNFLHIVFQSDGSNEGKGFYGSFKVKGRAEGKSCNVTHVCLENMTCVNGHCSCGHGQYYNTSYSLCIPGNISFSSQVHQCVHFQSVMTTYIYVSVVKRNPVAWTTQMLVRGPGYYVITLAKMKKF
ncbi:unnamed protein product [Lymnaea stagnalis]|uniref:CUB domain-containing protein n=1 Tax=Lymnaea stagnalis TaxID=6523 RepID=A0AAV2IHU2_LYMST